MRLQTHRDESRSKHFDLTGGGHQPWSIGLVAAKQLRASASRASLVSSLPCGSTNRRDCFGRRQRQPRQLVTAPFLFRAIAL
jgi:hypothetical protein